MSTMRSHKRWAEWACVATAILLVAFPAVAAAQDRSFTSTNRNILGVNEELTAGLSWGFAERWELDVGFSEDINVDTAPDFVIQAGLRYRPQTD